MRRLALLFGLIPAPGCSDEEGGIGDRACIGQRIVGGSSSATLAELDTRQVRALVALSVPTETGLALCSGVAIARAAILTAGHCIDGDRDGVVDERPAGAPEATIFGSAGPALALGEVQQAWLHPSLDVALLEVAWAFETEMDMTPIPANFDPIDSSWVGTPSELAGYGQTESGTLGILSFVVEEIVRVETDHVVVDGRGRTGACIGDSGGPMLVRADDGRIRVLGVLDDGDRTCTGEDFFTRTDRLLGWEPFDRLALDDSPALVDCDGLSRSGLCLRDRAMWCADNQIQSDRCSVSDLGCGWDRATQGFRCVPIEEDSCRGLGSFGRCEGGSVVRCNHGLVETVDCEMCEMSCLPWADGAGAGCR